MSETREQILEVASRLFLDRGFDKTSLREVAEGVGVTKAALYYHFPSKEDLLAALLEPVAAATSGIEAMVEADDLEAWAGGLEEFIGWMLENRRLFELIEHNEAAVEGLPSAKSSFGEAHQRFHAAVDARIADPDLPLDMRVRLMCSIGTAISVAHFGAELDADTNLDAVRATMVEAMRACLGLPSRRGTAVP